ncbi:PP2C family protein-serine/threonine phosphatase [Streptomyces sp. BE20]|uniref:PP2C family protein-serine/threonine phosphatase n=1 Tax=Streptomyces sp. BE20 TaxID=3002525 RepID=UPI002E7A55D7|nr:PP2C family protein-serine/threonine phosphatase [Streptomyces sp. BE20]MEE1827048.1 PP2C family protein-serine/threonine phosphatase [Streptomyces sp. BE20]
MADETLPLNLGEQLLEEFLTARRTLDPADVPTIAQRYTQALGLGSSTVYLADIQQNQLFPLAGGANLPIDGTLAGWAYRTGALRVGEDGADTLLAWLPLVDGAERLGVLGVRTTGLDAGGLRRCRLLAAMTAMVITSKRDTSDSYARSTRAETMSLPAEMLRAFLPVRTVSNSQVISTAVLEPAYDLGGDAFDHSLAEGVLHAAVLDAMGHDLASGLTAAVALAACRNARRNGADLPDLVATIDDAIQRWFPDRFVTGVFARLDLATGTLHWATCGHPPPLLIRGREVVADALARTSEPPLGLAGLSGAPRSVHTFSLRPSAGPGADVRAADGRRHRLPRPARVLRRRRPALPGRVLPPAVPRRHARDGRRPGAADPAEARRRRRCLPRCPGQRRRLALPAGRRGRGRRRAVRRTPGAPPLVPPRARTVGLPGARQRVARSGSIDATWCGGSSWDRPWGG